MSKIVIFYVDVAGNSGHWIVQADRYQHCLAVLEAKRSIVTGYEKIV